MHATHPMGTAPANEPSSFASRRHQPRRDPRTQSMATGQDGGLGCFSNFSIFSLLSPFFSYLTLPFYPLPKWLGRGHGGKYGEAWANLGSQLYSYSCTYVATALSGSAACSAVVARQQCMASRGSPGVVWPLSMDGTVGQMDPWALCRLFGLALLVLSYPRLLLLEHDCEA